MLKILSWNINQQDEPWRLLADSDADVALLQEARPPPADVLSRVELDTDTPWATAGAGMQRPWRTAVVRLSDRVILEPRRCVRLEDAGEDEVPVSRPGTLAVADLTVRATGEVVTLASVYGVWESPVSSVGGRWIFADASVHRLISDLSALIGRERGHKIIVAGDLNILRGYGEHGSQYWGARYGTVFDRMEALGLTFVGPKLPGGGEPPEVRPSELPEGSPTVPTFRTKRSDPATATRQLDFVFASAQLHSRLRVRALNGDSEWGPSDHCRVSIRLD